MYYCYSGWDLILPSLIMEHFPYFPCELLPIFTLFPFLFWWYWNKWCPLLRNSKAIFYYFARLPSCYFQNAFLLHCNWNDPFPTQRKSLPSPLQKPERRGWLILISCCESDIRGCSASISPPGMNSDLISQNPAQCNGSGTGFMGLCYQAHPSC